MVKFGKYTIEIIDKYGGKAGEITDFQTLKIIDIVNETGSWKVETTSKTRCPIQPGYSVRILRDGVQIYSGVVLRITEEYLVKYNTWIWSASGENHNKILDWKIILPEEEPSEPGWASDREFVMENESIPYIIRTLISNNAKYANAYHRTVGGFYTVTDPQEISPIQRPTGSVHARAENLFDVISSLANNGGLVVLPVFTDKYNTGDYFVIYTITCGSDLSNTVVFRDDQDQITSFRHTLACPDATDVIMSYNSEDTKNGDPTFEHLKMYHYIVSSEIPNNAAWRTPYQVRELFVKPKKEDFGGDFSKEKLKELCKTYANGIRLSADCYEVEINPAMASYTYGYDWTDPTTHYVFSTDYRLGDTIGIIVNGTKYTGKVTRMEFDVSYGKETIRPTIGEVSRGKFNGILNNLSNLKKSTSKTDNTEVR